MQPFEKQPGRNTKKSEFLIICLVVVVAAVVLIGFAPERHISVWTAENPGRRHAQAAEELERKRQACTAVPRREKSCPGV